MSWLVSTALSNFVAKVRRSNEFNQRCSSSPSCQSWFAPLQSIRPSRHTAPRPCYHIHFQTLLSLKLGLQQSATGDMQ